MPHQGTSTSPATVQTPTTSAELGILMSRRNELTEQLQSLSARHSQLVGERYLASANQNQAVVTELDGRIREFSQRITRIEREKLQTDDAISAGIARGLSSSEVVILPPPTQTITIPSDQSPIVVDVGPPGSSGSDREIAFGALGLVLLAVIAWRWTKRAGSSRRSAELAGESAGTRDLRVAVESIALEVERISENQRFITKLLADKAQIDPALLERGKSAADRTLDKG